MIFYVQDNSPGFSSFFVLFCFLAEIKQLDQQTIKAKIKCLIIKSKSVSTAYVHLQQYISYNCCGKKYLLSVSPFFYPHLTTIFKVEAFKTKQKCP